MRIVAERARLSAQRLASRPVASDRASAKTARNAIAAAVAERLSSRLQQQARLVRQGGNEAEIKAYRQAQFVMAALAEIDRVEAWRAGRAAELPGASR